MMVWLRCVLNFCRKQKISEIVPMLVSSLQPFNLLIWVVEFLDPLLSDLIKKS